jgi:hypothetical protein
MPVSADPPRTSLDELRPYYDELIREYFPAKIAW